MPAPNREVRSALTAEHRNGQPNAVAMNGMTKAQISYPDEGEAVSASSPTVTTVPEVCRDG
jgi:hypothetical protein